MPLRAAIILVSTLAVPVHAVEHQVQVRDSTFSPAMLTIEAGDSVTWTHTGVLPHNVRADDDSFRCARGCDEEGGNGGVASGGWSFTRTFNDPEEIPYYCEAHGSPGGVGMSGLVSVIPAGNEPDFVINFGLIGSWFNPDSSGQGFLFDLVLAQDPPQLVAYWFTYDTEAGGPEAQRWLIAQGPFEGQTDRVMLEIFLVTGGAFNQGQPASMLQVIGTGLLQFHSCTSATLTFDIDFEGDEAQNITGEIPLQRLSPDVLCQELSGAAR